MSGSYALPWALWWTQELKREPPTQVLGSRRSTSIPKDQDRICKAAPYSVASAEPQDGGSPGCVGGGRWGLGHQWVAAHFVSGVRAMHTVHIHQAAAYAPFHSASCSCSSCGRRRPASGEVSACFLTVGERSAGSSDRLLSQPESRQKAPARCLHISEGLQEEQIYKQQTATFVLEARLNKLHWTAALTLSCKDGPRRYFYLLYSWVR